MVRKYKTDANIKKRLKLQGGTPLKLFMLGQINSSQLKRYVKRHGN